MKVLIINVAANSAMREVGGSGPVFDDLTFHYKPIPEGEDAGDGPNYRDLGLTDYVPDPNMKVHHDPEFTGPSYGDYLKNKPTLKYIGSGDVLLFLASLDHVRTRARGFYFIGWLLVTDVLSEAEARRDARCRKNAHLLRKDDYGFVVFVGKSGGLLPKAVPVTRAIAEQTMLPADGMWKIRNSRTGRTFQDIERINHLTRFPRLVSDPARLEILRSELVKVTVVDIFASSNGNNSAARDNGT